MSIPYIMLSKYDSDNIITNFTSYIRKTDLQY